MKKISLKNLDSLGIEKLSRENLRKVTGGTLSCWVEDGTLNCCQGLSQVYNPVTATCDNSHPALARYSCSCALKFNGTETIFNIDYLAHPSQESCDEACKTNCISVNNAGNGCSSYRAVFASKS